MHIKKIKNWIISEKIDRNLFYSQKNNENYMCHIISYNKITLFDTIEQYKQQVDIHLPLLSIEEKIKEDNKLYAFYKFTPLMEMINPINKKNLIKSLIEILTFYYHTKYIFYSFIESAVIKNDEIYFIPSDMIRKEFSAFNYLSLINEIFNIKLLTKFSDNAEKLMEDMKEISDNKKSQYEFIKKESEKWLE